MFTVYLKKKDWIDLLENFESRTTKVNEVSISKLEDLKKCRSLMFCLPKAKEAVPYDGYQWTGTILGKRYQPIYRKLMIDDEELNLIKCCEIKNSHFKKEILHMSDKTIVHYFLEDMGDLLVPDGSSVKKPRISYEDAEEIKKNILPLRTSSAAYAIAKEKGINVSRKQILNLQRMVKNSVTGKSGRRVVTSLENIRHLEVMDPDNLQYHINQAQELVFSYVRIYETGVKIFASACPTVGEYNDWIQYVDDLGSYSNDVKKEKLKEVLLDYPSGILFPSRLYVDSTYNLSDCYGTILLGESQHFRTKRSEKPRVYPIGFMLHSHRDSHHHEMFADRLKAFIAPFMFGKVAPAMLMDGETSLQVYADAFDSRVIRCDWHVIRLLSHKFGRKSAKTANFWLQNCYKTGNTRLERLENMVTKLEIMYGNVIESKVDPRIFNWIKCNQNWLMETATALPKLKSGMILQYTTSNPSETFNKMIKTVVQKPLPVTNLLERLDAFCSDKLHEIRKAAFQESDYVSLHQDIRGMDQMQKKTHFEKIGLECPTLLSFDPPRLLMKELNIRKTDSEEKKCEFLKILSATNDSFVLQDDSVALNEPNRVVLVACISDIFECTACNQTMPDFICRHMLKILQFLPELDRRMQLWKMEGVLRGDSGITVPIKSGRKQSDRIGTKLSSNNHIRRITEVTQMTIFDSSEEVSSDISGSISDSILPDTTNHFHTHDSTVDSNLIGINRHSTSIVLGTPEPQSLSDSTFSPLLSSTANNNISEQSISKRNRRSTRRFSPSEASSSSYVS
ncbi:hypothetical protein CRE_28724 [Caenorhabditis remanei]|uniref:SWIM-type domain-containing protein n=1 Tax=Caenorhabditis remanei TaxID=31234 RepID=E3MK72_CAERE|nr:hypothetical protein CRE_28724 [Caenorhabditis remanei]